MMDFKLPLLGLCLFNFALIGTRAILGGVIFNGIIERSAPDWDQTLITDLFLFISFIACMAGTAASVFGVIHCVEWKEVTRFVALGLTLLAACFEFLVVGFSGKQWNLETFDSSKDLEGRLHFMAIGNLVNAFLFACMALLLLAPIQGSTTNMNEDGGMTDEHHDDEAVGGPAKTA